MYPSFLFIRHGQSVHNQKAQQVHSKFSSHPNFKQTPEYKEIKYNPQLRDGSITNLGQNQAKQAKQIINISEIGVVVISPLRRALQTCDLIFGDQKDIKFYVEPLLCERLSSAVDICDKIKQSREIYGKTYNFDRIPVENQDKWYLNMLVNEENRNHVLSKVDKEGMDVSSATLSVLKNTQLETYHELKNRIKFLKEQLVKYKQLTNKKVALIGHAEIFLFLSATGFGQDAHPINGVALENCVPRQIPIIIEGYHEEDEEVAPFCKIP